MKIRNHILTALFAAAPFAASAANPGVLISGFLANPNGADSPNEYIQLIATKTINFSVTPYSLVAATNGVATTNGWIQGGALTYGFNISTGVVNRGDVFYVGGSGKILDGTTNTTSLSGLNWLRSIDTGTVAGDGFGSAASAGVIGNGGSNDDGIAVFASAISSVTASTVPVDAVFYGSSTGTTVVSGGASGYVLPVNDRYSGGYFQTTTFIFSDPGADQFVKLTGAYNADTDAWLTARTSSLVTISSGSTASAINTALVVVPEPSSFVALIGGLGLLGICRLRRL